jgi:hypothetical protein
MLPCVYFAYFCIFIVQIYKTYSLDKGYFHGWFTNCLNTYLYSPQSLLAWKLAAAHLNVTSAEMYVYVKYENPSSSDVSLDDKTFVG